MTSPLNRVRCDYALGLLTHRPWVEVNLDDLDKLIALADAVLGAWDVFMVQKTDVVDAINDLTRGGRAIVIAIDLFCGLGGWTEGLQAAGLRVVGFDNTRHVYGEHRYPAQLVIQDVRTLHGSQFKDAALIVASPPCQAYSYMAMPWKRAKALAADYRDGRKSVADLNELFDSCFRIQREACEASGRHIPLVVENVCGAQQWVGRAAYRYGSFYLWGDIPALMPSPARLEAVKAPGMDWNSDDPAKGGCFRDEAIKRKGFRFDGSGKSFQQACVDGIKNSGGSWFNVAHNTTSGKGRNPDGRNDPRDGTKVGGDWFGAASQSPMRQHHSKSTARKAASAMIAKIPFALAKWIGHVAVAQHKERPS